MSSRADPDRLASAPLTVLGRFLSASNVTLLCHLGPLPRALEARRADPDAPPLDPDDLDPADLAIYKPEAGEAPLWDFPDGTLHLREVAAYEVDRLLGWGFVPVTLLRDDGPGGRGAVQAYVPHDPDRHYFWMVEQGGDEILAQLRRMVAFDLIIDNADRKGGHVLLDDEGCVRLVDHGVSFHVERKLRTVAWHFAGEPVPDEVRRAAGRLAGLLRVDGPEATVLHGLLSGPEIERLVERAEEVAELERFPDPEGPRPYPWPLL